MSDSELDGLLREWLAERERLQQLRTRSVVEALDGVHVRVGGRDCVNFASNNYLGLSHHARLVEAVRQAAGQYGVGAGASALITGYTAAHASAEAALARWKGTEAAVLLPSGYQAAHAVVQTLRQAAEAAGRPVRFLVDRLAHASLIDAVRGWGASYRVFPHNHMVKLERLLAASSAGQLDVVVTESIFSMDGDAADLSALAGLKARYPFVLVLDEAHGSGVYGADGAGYAAEVGMQHAVDITIVTLSKAIGLAGAAACGSAAFASALVNWGRALVYSTNVPPATAAAAEAAIGVMRDEPWRQQRLRRLARRLRQAMSGYAPEGPAGECPILPVVLGSESRALAAAERLRERGLLVAAVRPPTVPRGTSRLRATVSCVHSDDEIDHLIAALADVARADADR